MISSIHAGTAELQEQPEAPSNWALRLQPGFSLLPSEVFWGDSQSTWHLDAVKQWQS
jgi:hypothetical protein